MDNVWQRLDTVRIEGLYVFRDDLDLGYVEILLDDQLRPVGYLPGQAETLSGNTEVAGPIPICLNRSTGWSPYGWQPTWAFHGMTGGRKKK